MSWFARRSRAQSAELELTFERDMGVPHPEWAPFFDALHVLDDPVRIQVELKQAARSWVIAFAEASGGALRPVEGRRAFAAAPEGDGEQIVLLADKILDDLGGFLGGVAESVLPLVIFKVATRDQYVDVLHHWDGDGEGETRGDSAVCIFSEVPHILMPAGEDYNLGSTLGHEATHACLHAHRPPAWLDEGLAQIAQERFGGQALASMTHARKEEHLAHWDEVSIQRLWNGEAFHSVDEESMLAYEASFAIVSNMITDFSGDMAAFVAAAGGMLDLGRNDRRRVEDFGDSAAHDVFGVSLRELAASFLGEGSWQPWPTGRTDR